jgi:ADP-ribose pyrophosphatase YjhB (NUDIX family)
MSMTIWKPNVVVAAIVEKDGRFLLVEEEADGRQVFNQPAGHLDEGESLLDAVRRETFEETAWHIEPQALVGVYRWRKSESATTFLRFCFAATADRHDPASPLDKEIVRTVWLSAREIEALGERLRSPLVMQCIRDYQAGRRYPLDLLHDVTS